MALLVQKFGGTSVGSLDRIRRVATRVADAHKAGNQLIVVVSAISGETDRLLSMGRDLSKNPAHREMDVLVSTGEQVSAALLAIALQELGTPARSLMGHQARILTDGAHTKARIQAISKGKLRETVDGGEVAVVAGFQGIDRDGNITTLGRGGSDTSAVAIAAALGADACEIYTDVEGVYTTDPNVCPSARKVDRVSYEEMLELSSLGAKVLQLRSVEMAMKHGVKLHVRSTFSESEGTWVVGEEESLEAVVVSGVTYDRNETKLTVTEIPDRPGIVAAVFEPLAEHNISVDMIIQNASSMGHTDLTFTVPKGELDRATELAQAAGMSIGAKDVIVDREVAKVSVVGLGMRSHAGVAAKLFRILADKDVNIIAISTSEIKVSCLIPAEHVERAVQSLHDGFGLGERKSLAP